MRAIIRKIMSLRPISNREGSPVIPCDVTKQSVKCESLTTHVESEFRT